MLPVLNLLKPDVQLNVISKFISCLTENTGCHNYKDTDDFMFSEITAFVARVIRNT